MRSIAKKTLIWGIWLLGLLVINICFSLQSTQDAQPLIMKLPQNFLFCSIPYVFFTMFYLIALITMQFHKIMYLLIADVISVVVIISNWGYFYEGTLAARNFIVIIILAVILKCAILIKRKNVSPN